MGVVVGVDGSGRTHRLDVIAADARAPVLRITPPIEDATGVTECIEAALADGSIVLVDDAHRLSPDVLRALAAGARQGVDVVIARRPTIDQPELAELDEVVAARRGVERLQPLDETGIAALIASTTGKRPSPEQVDSVLTASAGMPAVAAALAAVPAGDVPPTLVARIQRRLATMDPAVTRFAVVLALRLDLSDDVLVSASGIAAERLPATVRALRDQGMLVPGHDRMIPAVAAAVLSEVSPTERRRLHHDVARALLAGGADPVTAGIRLRAAGARGREAAEVYRMAGDRLRFEDPEASLGWFTDAAEAGADPRSLLAARAEASALLGHPVDVAGETMPADAGRLALVDGAAEAHQGRTDRAADALLAAGSLGRLLAVPALVATGRLGEAAEAMAVAGGDAPRPLRRFAEAALAAPDPTRALPLFIEAAEALEYATPAVVLPDTPHAIGALIAVTAGDAGTAVRLIEQALAAGAGGPVAEPRHRLLRAWVRLRAGRYDAAVAETRRMVGRALSGRDRLLAAAIAAGLARRSGDIAHLRESWADAENVLARRAVDLFQVEVMEELLVAAARLGEFRRATPTLDALQAMVDRLERPPIWSIAISWVRLQVVVALDDADLARSIADEIAEMSPEADRPRAQCRAAGCWADVLADRVPLDEVVAATDALASAELPWEASRLAGQAAIRAADPSAARRLLERARDLIHAEPADERTGVRAGLLSERETEVAKLVLAGRTHREIGAQLFVSPKTVEHHVARIRTKLGVTTRADFIVALRELLETNTVADSSLEFPNAVS